MFENCGSCFAAEQFVDIKLGAKCLLTLTSYDHCVTQNIKWRIFMLVCDYIVESIDGDYAHLRRTDLPEEELKLVARALLPFDITEGCRLHYEMMQYSIID